MKPSPFDPPRDFLHDANAATLDPAQANKPLFEEVARPSIRTNAPATAPSHGLSVEPPALNPRDPRDFVPLAKLPLHERDKLAGVRTDVADRSLTKYVLVLDDYDHTTSVLSEFLGEHAMSTAGVNMQPLDPTKRSPVQRAFDATWTYGPITPTLRTARRAAQAARSKVTECWLRQTRNPIRPETATKHFGVKADRFENVNDPEFIKMLAARGVELLVCLGCNQVFSDRLRTALPFGAINVHHGLLPHYRGLDPTFHTLADRQKVSGVSVHYATQRLNDGPILAERFRSIRPEDSVAAVTRRQQPLAADALLQAVRKIEFGSLTIAPNPDPVRPIQTAPQRRDVRRLKKAGRKLG